VTEVNRPAEVEHYSGVARFFHWLTVVLVAIMLSTGLFMVYRAKDLNIWDDLTNTLYSTHKTTGLLLLAVIVSRLVYRLVHGAPDDEPTLNIFHRFMSHATHWAIYGLLILMPLLGWLGISLFPALQIFGGYSIPPLTAPDQGLSKQVFALHEFFAYVLMILIGMHIGAALYHHTIRGDNVLRRMLPGIKRRG